MTLRSAWTGLVLLMVLAVSCFGPACGVACAAKVPCHDGAMMSDCNGMISVSATMHHVATCAQDEALIDRSDLGVDRLVAVSVVHPGLKADAVGRQAVVKAVRGEAKSPPRLAWCMRV
jgi:hypothetical protein